MACYSPLTAEQAVKGEPLNFAPKGFSGRDLIQIACGQCIGCRLERSRMWAVRCVHEAQMHDASCFVTLTYSTEHLAQGSLASLDYSHFQLFMKKLRHKFPGVRFYMAGEYGGRTWRPHFHAILFGCWFADRKFKKRLDSGFNLYVSSELDRLWTFGFANVADFSFDAAAYIARYCTVKITGPKAETHYCRPDLNTGEMVTLRPEFNRMSLKPGIGALWFRKYMSQVYPRDYVVVNGMKVKPPRYYDQLAVSFPHLEYDDVQYSRYLSSLNVLDDTTPERLRVREVVTRARLAFGGRSL